MITTKRPVRLVLFCTALLCPACGGKGLVDAKGTVTLDGEPVEGAGVTFFPIADGEAGAEPGTAATDADGGFSLANRGAEGVKPGRYKVVVTKWEVPETKAKKFGQGPGKARMNAAAKAKNLLPKTYSDVNTTPLEVEVPPGGSNDLDVELTSEGK